MISVTVFMSCKKNKDNISVENKEALNQTMFADQTEGKSITFVTTGAWTSSITEKTPKSTKSGTWLSMNPYFGNAAGTYTITIKLEPNATGVERTALIILTCNDTDIHINITQKATTEDGETIVKLLEAVTDGNGVLGYKYEYDNLNRIERISFGETYSAKFIYNDGELVRIEKGAETEEYNKIGNTITITVKSGEYVNTSKLYLNEDNLPSKYEYEYGILSSIKNYQYLNGNVNKIFGTQTLDGHITEHSIEYEYDNMKSPFYNCKTPKWYMIWYFQERNSGTLNNIIRVNGTENYVKGDYQYEYDLDGFPTKQIYTNYVGEKFQGGFKYIIRN